MVNKIYLYLASSVIALDLIAQDASALTELSGSTIVIPEQIVFAEVMSAAATSDAVVAVDFKKIPTTTAKSPLVAQTPPAAIPQEQTPGSTPMDKVTSVSQFSDVQPTDWAFQALQFLIERYGCITGYPNGTFRGSHALTRYEFTTGLSNCLNKISEQVKNLSSEDLEMIQRLQDEFANELAILRRRVNILEARTQQLEGNQFSPTTKLSGVVAVAVAGGVFSGDRIIDATGREITNKDPNATIIYRASVDFDTSFSGTDLLKVRLEVGSDRAGDHAAGFLEPSFGSFLDFSYRSAIDDMFSVTQLSYSFTPSPDLAVTVAQAIDIAAFVDKNSYANPSLLNFSTTALINNYILFPFPPGATAAIDWNPGKGPFKVRGVYVGSNAAKPSSNNQNFMGPATPLAMLLFPGGGGGKSGLFGDSYQSIFEVEYAPNKAFATRLTYSGGQIFDNHFDVFGVNFELALSQQVAVFGRYGYGSYNNTTFGNINPHYWMAGIGFSDLFIPGALAGIAAGQPFIENAIGNATQTNMEAFYNFPIRDNIRITPLIQVITDPGNQKSNGTIVTGTVRTVFSF